MRPPPHLLLCHAQQTSNITTGKRQAAICCVPSGPPAVRHPPHPPRAGPSPWGALGRTKEGLGRGLLLTGPPHSLPPILFAEDLGRTREQPKVTR